MTANQTAALIINGLALITLVVGGSGHPLVPRRLHPGRLIRAHDLRDPSPHDGYRVVFYAARSVTLVFAYLWVPWMAVILLIFYLVKREMPYDLIP